jgi:4-amino-4-deoxy-L-arabinose transferase-like glycosyltransferase
MTLNETKGTVILLPMALIVVTLLMPGIKIKFKKSVFVIGSLLVLAGIFIPIYDHYQKPRYGVGIKEFYTSEAGVQRSLYRGVEEDNLFYLRPGRVDAIILPLEILGQQPFKLIFGLGIGNVSPSFLKRFEGEFTKYERLIRGSLSNLLWEIGILGVILFLAFFWFVFFDAKRLRYSNDLSGAVALGWIGVVIILVLSLVYINYIHRNVIVYLFWYISGYIAAESCRARAPFSRSAMDNFSKSQLT